MIKGVLLVDLGARTIQGRAVPYGPTGRIGGRRYQFRPGWWYLNGPVYALRDHDNSQRGGRAIHLAEAGDGLYTVLRIKRGRFGDRLLADAVAGLLGLSVGVRREQLLTGPEHPGVHVVVSALLAEITLTRTPAFP